MVHILGRSLNLRERLSKKSYFLFGPRGTGKSTLIKEQFSDVLVLDLLDQTLYRRLNNDHSILEQLIETYQKESNSNIVVIDEVQLIPGLLNQVHRVIENKRVNFLLTGSSARKLRRGQANLLAGRARVAELFSLTYLEIPNFDLDRYLSHGGLPMVYLGDDPIYDIASYVNTYLKEEIKVEALTRKIDSFSDFLRSSAITSGKLLNFANVAQDSGVAPSTVRDYYQILEDTFMGFIVPAWTKTIKRKAISRAKFYYFDIGVRNALADIKNVEPNSDIYGQAFEHFIASELRAYISYKNKFLSLNYWQSKSGIEVDFIVDDAVAIGVKSTNNIQSKHLKGLRTLREEDICNKYIVVSLDKLTRVVDSIDVMYWKDFLEALWQGKLF